ncbi:hypothetical protein [Altibacter sp.]|nr:hypothetical protein [Altibacter sp.]
MVWIGQGLERATPPGLGRVGGQACSAESPVERHRESPHNKKEYRYCLN